MTEPITDLEEYKAYYKNWIGDFSDDLIAEHMVTALLLDGYYYKGIEVNYLNSIINSCTAAAKEYLLES